MNKIEISRGSVIRRCTWWRGILDHLKHVSSLLSGYSSDFRGRDFYTCYIILDVFKIPTPSGKQRVKVAACEQTYHFERREKKVARERPRNWQSRGGWQGKLFLSPPPPPRCGISFPCFARIRFCVVDYRKFKYMRFDYVKSHVFYLCCIWFDFHKNGKISEMIASADGMSFIWGRIIQFTSSCRPQATFISTPE